MGNVYQVEPDESNLLGSIYAVSGLSMMTVVRSISGLKFVVVTKGILRCVIGAARTRFSNDAAPQRTCYR